MSLYHRNVDRLDGTDLVVLGQMEDCKGTIDKTL
jgi:hypothetical protein